MYADEISKKIDLFEKLPYKCICFDGVWGIGKTYAAENIVHKETTVRVSLSGVKNADEIYDEILDAFIGKNGLNNVVGKLASTAVKVASNFEGTKIASSIVSDITGEFLSSKAALRIYFSRLKKLRIVILDDFERVWDEIDITEVFRVIDFLTSQKQVKVVILGDLTKLPSEINDKFQVYSERYIDRIYKITDIAKDIDWKSIDIDQKFILQFRKLHPFHNLRNVIKGNKLYLDIRQTLLQESTIIKENDLPDFWNDLRLTCFATVIEDIEKLGLESASTCNDNKSPVANTLTEIKKRLDNRIIYYLPGSIYSDHFVRLVLKYYQDSEMDLNGFEETYEIPAYENNVNYFYMDAASVKEALPKLYQLVMTSTTETSLISCAKDYMQVSKLIQQNTDLFLEDFRIRFHNILSASIDQGKHIFNNFARGIYFESNDQIKQIVTEESIAIRKNYIDSIIDQLHEGCDFPESYEKVKLLIDFWTISTYQKYITSRITRLETDKILPIHADSQDKYYASVQILKLINEIDQDWTEELSAKLDEIEMDPVARNRCICALRDSQN